MKKCITCNSDVPNYRDNARPADPAAPKRPLISINLAPGTVRQIFWSSLLVALIGVCVFAVFSQLKKESDNERHYQQYADSMGYVVIEYTAHGGLIPTPDNRYAARCWIMQPAFRQGQYNNRRIVGPTYPGDEMHIERPSNLGWVEVPNRNDADGFAKHAGVADPSTCIR